ncbi:MULTISPECIES: DUF1127 domain-containing protein [Roseomonadaceae]|uniref:DUF1127 domain-containing protein n=1 Tax=Falsiroseomonas oleicola TaxID=2801474 RepID=A0ABS6HFD6_9PROT|nr:DUF1127 domain-containing protein [Roseomonas oleicola]MBU8546206.1 DUF1127 domain-containing protein [Roseomonas oleicola]
MPRVTRLGRALLDLLALWLGRAAQRRLLGGLPDAALKDLGLSRADAVREARKPFWRG